MSATTRRTALRGAGFAGLAGMIGMTTAKAATQTPDAELIRCCGERMALQREFDELFNRRHTIEDEHRTEPELMVLYDRETEIEDRISALPAPVSLAGACALARIALVKWRAQNGPELETPYFDEWVNISIAEYLAGEVGT